VVIDGANQPTALCRQAVGVGSTVQ
jgi:hypothetical protein